LFKALGSGPEHIITNLDTFTTMEISWLLIGLVHSHKRHSTSLSQQFIKNVCQHLIRRQEGETGLFYNASHLAPFLLRARRHVPNFADQIYAIQALSMVSAHLSHSESRIAATSCAHRICRLQGTLGQWWWHYNPSSGKVIESFPVYSVHQHSMAPMALSALHFAGGPDFRISIERGFSWLSNNELNINMIDWNAKTIWRDIELDEGIIAKKLRHLRLAAGRQFEKSHSEKVRLRCNYETRPYEWGWYLYAHSLNSVQTHGCHIV